MMHNIIKVILSISAILFMAGSSASAQHYLGIRGGYGGGTGRFYPKPSESGTVWGLYNGGISWKYYSPERIVGGVEVDLLFMQQGYREYTVANLPEGSTEKPERLSYYQRTVNSITIPAYWQTYGYLFMRKMRVFLNLGVTLSYNYSSWEEQYDYRTGEKESGKYDMMLVRDNPLTYGLGGGVGIGWSFGRLEILAEARYFFGYGDILRNRNKYEENPMRSPLDSYQITAGIYWRLGKKGILAPPGPKLEAKLREIELRQIEEQQRIESERTVDENITGEEKETVVEDVETDDVIDVPDASGSENPVSAAASEGQRTDDGISE